MILPAGRPCDTRLPCAGSRGGGVNRGRATRALAGSGGEALMSALRIGVVLALVAAATDPGLAAAQTSLTVLSAIAPRQSAILIVDALPLEAEVRLDGVVIGTAR